MDDVTDREIEKLVKQISDKLLHERREIYPSAKTEIIKPMDKGRESQKQTWGFPHFDPKKSGVIFNARSETVQDKRMFKDSVMTRRCIIPAAGYFEWNSMKDKYQFTSPDREILLFAGFYKEYGDEKRFVILTTEANESIKSIHDRMPLILDASEMDYWLLDDTAVKSLLKKRPKELDKQIQGQMTLFDLADRDKDFRRGLE